MNKNSINYVKSYLQYAIEFEKNVYIWQNAMSTANKRMQELSDEKNYLKREIQQSSARNICFDESTKERFYLTELKKYKAKRKTPLIILFVYMFLAFGFGCAIGFGMCEDAIDIYTILTAGLYCMGFGAIVPGFMLIPIFVVIYSNNKQKIKKLEFELEQIENGKHIEIVEIISEEQNADAKYNYDMTVREEKVLSMRQDEIFVALKNAKMNRQRFYAENVIPEKYRSLETVATLYEYIDTGRCNTVTGHGGIYDTYETERVQIAQLMQMIRMNDTLDRLENNQRYICRQLANINTKVAQIESSLKDIQKTNAQIARNSAVAAESARQTEMVVKYQEWRIWASGRY